jgi:uncharacterized protein YyaL (SSP411 family)
MLRAMRQYGPVLALVVAAGVLAGLPAGAAAPPAGKPRGKHSNRLARESSPYLLQHAHNPVDWYPWGPEAFARAKKEKKLIFLSIGYSSCHWCHVMEKESFANAEVAKLLNKHFICIKVDREERPEVDHLYMTALNVQGISGGWPLSMFLQPDGKPIVGGTYWPREDREIDGEKVRGFKTILQFVVKLNKEKPALLRERADEVAKQTAAALAGAVRGLALVELDRKLVSAAVEALEERFDRVHGGFGSPKNRFRGARFPQPPYLLLLLGEAKRAKSRPAETMLTVTLDHLARGGIYDHIGGGFHRYSTERTWTVPHFEKMLYDNAQLLEVYAGAYQRTKKPLYARVLRQTADFVARELTAPAGAFYSALDADSEGEEGRFYVWTTKELNEVLTDKADRDLFKKVYGAEAPNFEGKYHILRLPRPLAEQAKELKTSPAKLEARLVGLRQRLFAVRAKRPRPFLDTKVVTGWNGQMIAGLARAGQALDEPKRIAAATRAADFLLANLRTRDGRLLRTWAAAPGEEPKARVPGFLDDYAYLVHGLLTLHDVTGQKRWLAEAKALTETMVKYHADLKGGGFFYTAHDHEKLFARVKDQYDGVQPSGNSTAAANLVRLWVKTGEARYGKLAEKTFRALAAPLQAYPTSLTGLTEALALYLEAKKK